MIFRDGKLQADVDAEIHPRMQEILREEEEVATAVRALEAQASVYLLRNYRSTRRGGRSAAT